MAETQIITKKKGIVYAIVYAPWQIDTQGEMMLPEEIVKSAHNFLASGRVSAIDTEHDWIPNGCRVVESFIARKNDPDFPAGAWVFGIQTTDETLAKIEKGELNALSFASLNVPERKLAAAYISTPISGTGTTEPYGSDSIAEHVHSVELKFDASGRIIPTLTSIAENHAHEVFALTATQANKDHAHRMVADLLL